MALIDIVLLISNIRYRESVWFLCFQKTLAAPLIVKSLSKNFMVENIVLLKQKTITIITNKQHFHKYVCQKS